MRLLVGLALVALLAGGAGPAAGPVFSDTGPDAAAYGAARGYPLGTRAHVNDQELMVGSYSHFDAIFSSHRVASGGQPSTLLRAAEEIAPQYYFQGRWRAIDAYLDRNPTTGLLIARDDTILFEHYQYGRTDRDRLLSQSMAKTVTAMLIGIAVSEGAIRSIDDTAATYVPELAGSVMGESTLRALLHMASGVAFTEDYGGSDDSAKFGRLLFAANSPGPIAAVRQFNTRDVPPGTRFHYAGIQTEVLGLVLSRVTHGSLAEYAHSRIWQPMGAEMDAAWATDTSGQEPAYCCFTATLRDWARFALLLAHDGVWNGRQIVPRQWVLDATSVRADEAYLAPNAATGFYGYGYQIWLFPGVRRQFALLGVHGQAIFVDPASKLVLVHTAVRVKPTGDPGSTELIALWNAVVSAYGN